MSDIKLLQNLFIFHKCRLTIEQLSGFAYNELNKRPANDTSIPLAVPIINMILLETRIFFEEYHDSFKSRDSNLNERIMILKKICKPITSQISKWKDLKKYRNEIIAHTWRNEKGEFEIAGAKHYKIPRTWVDLFSLSLYVQYIHNLIIEEFKIENAESISRFLRLENTEPVQSISINDYNTKNIEMVKEVNKLCEIYKKEYLLKIILYKSI